MQKILNYVLDRSSERLEDKEYEGKHKVRKQDFTRKRKLGFKLTMLFVLNLLRHSLKIEMDGFYEALQKRDVQRATSDAMIKARSKIQASAFVELSEMVSDICMESDELPTFRGYRVFAVDGTRLMLEGTKDLLEKVGSSQNDPKRAEARASVLCEVQAQIVIDANIGPLRIGEREMAQGHLERYYTKKRDKDIVLFDRGYPSHELIASLCDHGALFVMRLSKSFNEEADRMGIGEKMVKIRHGKKDYAIRVIKCMLKTGQEEMLATNLEESAFDGKGMMELYGLRWGAETTYDTLKNKLEVERFSGRSWQFVQQDFYATMYVLNIIAMQLCVVNERIAKRDQKKVCKYVHRASRNVLIGKMKNTLIQAVATDSKTKRRRLLSRVYREASTAYYCHRPDREVPRTNRKETHHKKFFPRKRAL